MKRLLVAAVVAGSAVALSLPASADPSACIGQVTLSVAGTTVVDQGETCVPPGQ